MANRSSDTEKVSCWWRWSHPAGSLCLMLLLLDSTGGCNRAGSSEREQEQRMLRAERLARERARRARNERVRRRNQKWRPKDPPRARPVPPRRCVPHERLKQKVDSASFDDDFAWAVQFVLSPVKADLVILKGRPVQRFTFAVPTHPDEEPRFGRKRPRPLLALTLRHEPLCAKARHRPPAPPGGQRLKATTHTLLVRLAPWRKGRRRGRWTTSLWPQKGGGTQTVPVGRQLQLLLDPAIPTLGASAPRTAPPKPDAIRGVWRLISARFPDRPRTRRLSLPSSKLPAALNLLHAVEVPCAKKPRKRCRFLTRQQGHRAIPLSLKELHRLSAPIKTRGRVLHLHAALLAIRFPSCTGANRRVTPKTARHPCVRWASAASRPACQFWRAQHGYSTPPTTTRGSGQWNVTRVLSCSGPKLKVIQLHESYTNDGKHTLRVSDLTKNTRKIDAALRRLTSRRRRR